MTSVRGHTRRTSSGGTTRVRQHRRGVVTPRHSWGLLRRALRALRQRRKVTACLLGGLAVVELGAWLALEGSALILATAGVLCCAGAVLAAQAGGVRVPAGAGKRPAQRGRPR